MTLAVRDRAGGETGLDTQAVILEAPGAISVRALGLAAPGPDDLLVAIDFSGVSSGTERLLFEGRMPAFPGMGYPLVPGYESVGRVIAGGGREGETVFVPGSTAFIGARGLFGGAARHVVLPGARAVTIPAAWGADGTLLALAATAEHAVAGGALPDLIVGHGVVGRLLARLCVAHGGTPTVWETNAARHDGAHDYAVVAPGDDPRRDYRVIVDASGDAGVLDTLVARLAPGGEIVLAGFYDRVGFAFAPAFMREARIRVAAEWKRGDLETVLALIGAGALSLGGLITHRADAGDAVAAYPTAFGDAACLKLILDWRHMQ